MTLVINIPNLLLLLTGGKKNRAPCDFSSLLFHYIHIIQEANSPRTDFNFELSHEMIHLANQRI